MVKLIPQPVKILRQPEVEARTGLKREWIRVLEHRGEFPRRIKISQKACGWVEAEITAWIEQRIAASRDQKKAA